MLPFQSYSIRAKLSVIMQAAAVPVAIMIIVLIAVAYRSDYRASSLAVQSTALTIANEHGAEVEGIRNLLTALSQFPEVRRKDSEACTRLIRNILKKNPFSYNIGMADTDGKLFASAVPGSFTIGDRKYFRDAIRTRAFSVGEYVISRAVGKAAIHFALPVLDDGGNPIAVIYTTYDLNRFNRLFDEQHLPPGAALNVTDHQGVLLYRYPKHEKVIPGITDAPHLRARMTGAADQGVFIDRGRDDVKRLLAFKRIQLNPGESPYIYIRVSIPAQVAFARVNNFVIASLLFFLVVSGGTFLVSRYLAGRFFVAPIEALNRMSEATGRGDLSVRSGLPHEGDEISMLARSFDQMADSLEQRQRERVQAEAALRESEMKLHAILDHMSDALFVHDVDDGSILDVNQAMCAMYGYDREEARHLDVAALSQGEPPYDQEHALGWMQAALAGEPQLFEWRARHRDGHLFWVEISMRRAPVGGEDRLLVLVRDISERKEAEAEKQSLTDQLAQAQRIESIGRLAGGIAHDFNNLLTPIIGYAELLAPAVRADERASVRLEGITQAASRAKDLIQQLLSFGRKQVLDLKDIDLNEVIDSFAGILRRTIRENIRISLKLAPLAECVRADKTQLEQILMNLVVNAQDAIDENGVITIETATVDFDGKAAALHPGMQPGKYVMLAVSDTGRGIPHEVQERIFDPFFTTKGIGEGTGLGLSTVHGIVKQHGGSIWLYSEPGKGTVFKLFFPLVPRCGPLQPVVLKAAAPAHRGGTILLVEDNPMVRDLVEDLLRNLSYEVLVGDTPEDGLALAEGRHLDLLISDVVMPGINGPELHRRLLERHPGLKVLFMSGYTDNIIAHQGSLPAGSSFIQKPFTIADLDFAVAAILAEGTA